MNGSPAGPGRIRLGVALPVFRRSPEGVFRAAAEAEAAGIDGLFVYDHLWPLGQPGSAALSAFPLLGALCRRTRRVALGTLVARVGVVPDAQLLSQLVSVDVLSRGRLVAGLGTGDKKNRGESVAYGIAREGADERRRALEELGGALIARGIETWVGGGSPATNAIARRLGCTLNLWSPPPERLASAALGGPVSWAGDLPAEPEEAARLLGALGGGALTWIVVHWPGSAERLLRAAAAAGLETAPR